nr:hypothetical protein [Grifola frondosa]
MNNFRLSTNNTLNNLQPVKDKVSYTNITESLKEKFLALPSLFIVSNDGQIINIKTGEIIRDTYVVEVIREIDGTISIFPTILDCAEALGVSPKWRATIYTRLASGKPLAEKGISKIRKIRVFNKIS